MNTCTFLGIIDLITVLLKFHVPHRLVRFRWVVPPSGETKLKLLFQSQADIGQFDQTLNFEITGTRRRTQLFCRGHCEMPTICQEPRSVNCKNASVSDALCELYYT